MRRLVTKGAQIQIVIAYVTVRVSNIMLYCIATYVLYALKWREQIINSTKKKRVEFGIFCQEFNRQSARCVNVRIATHYYKFCIDGEFERCRSNCRMYLIVFFLNKDALIRRHSWAKFVTRLS